MIQNEAPYLKEWIDYHHHVLGATYFYLYNNESTDHYEEVLAPYIKKGLVELIEWKSCEKNALQHETVTIPWVAYQIGAFNDCAKNRALKKVRWLSIQDVDEFIVPTQGATSFKKLLKKYRTLPLRTQLKNLFQKKHPSIGSLRLRWLVFGTSNVWDIDSNELLTEKLYLRSSEDHLWNKNVKCIHRPEAIDSCYVHLASLHKNYKHKDIQISDFRIHHYWSGPVKKLFERRNYSEAKLQEFSDEFNVVEDKTIFPYLSKIKNLYRS